MTLICAAFSAPQIAISDVAMSFSDGKPRKAVELPLRAGAFELVGTTALAGLAQKSVLIGNQTLVMWAGSAIVASYLIKKLAEASDYGSKRIELRDFMAGCGLSPDEIQSVSIIYQFSDSPDVVCASKNAKSSTSHGQRVVAAGSGLFDFFDDLQFTSQDIRSAKDIGVQWLSRVSEVLVRELTSGENLHQAYGGWFEITKLKDGHFQKVPVALMVHHLLKSDDGEIRSISNEVRFSSYVGRDLLIADVSLAPPPEGFARVWRLESPLEHTQVRDCTVEFEGEGVAFHVIVDVDRRASTTITRTGAEQGLTVRLLEDGPFVSMSEELMEELRAVARGDQAATIFGSRLSDPAFD